MGRYCQCGYDKGNESCCQFSCPSFLKIENKKAKAQLDESIQKSTLEYTIRIMTAIKEIAKEKEMHEK